MEVRLTKQRNQFVPCDHLSAEEMGSIADGQWFTAKLTIPRNIGHHRKFFALVNIVFENQEKHPTPDGMLEEIKIGIGHCTWHKFKRGKIVVEYAIPKSISFGKMSQPSFEKFYNSAVDYILKEILRGTDKQELEQQVLEIIGA